jgi:hypothetical protein
MSLHGAMKKVKRIELQEAAERVRVARTLAAAFPSAERIRELEAAIAAFNDLRSGDEVQP